MSSIIPAPFSFRFAMPAPLIEALPGSGKRLPKLPDDCRIFWPQSDLSELESPLKLRAAWNPEGLAVTAKVRGKQHPAVSDIQQPAETDSVQLWISTRNTSGIHRANRLCHHFCLLPNGAGPDGLDPMVKQLPIARATEDAPISPPEAFRIHSDRRADGYFLEAWFPASSLNGFDPAESKQLGFYAMLSDSELGEFSLTVDSAFPFASDPSLWQMLDLVGE